MSFGLDVLMEAIHESEAAMYESDILLEAMNDTVDDDVKAMVMDDDDIDDVETDMVGLGIDKSDSNKYKELLDLIPEDDEPDEDIESLIESVLF